MAEGRAVAGSVGSMAVAPEVVTAVVGMEAGAGVAMAAVATAEAEVGMKVVARVEERVAARVEVAMEEADAGVARAAGARAVEVMEVAG